MIKKRTPRHQKTLQKINDREKDRLGSSGAVNTKNFLQRQKFDPASEVKRINPDDLSPEELERLVITFSKKMRKDRNRHPHQMHK
jgi:hypothetical protein